jgi:hypothetical protein
MKMTVVLALGVGAAALIAAAMRDPAPATQSAASATAEPAAAAAAPDTVAQPPGDGAQVVEGKILEVIDVPSYTYLRIEQGNESVWTAVSSTKVTVGQNVRVRAQTKMENFASSTLKRTFESIYFGVVDDGSSADAPASAPALSGDPHGAASPHQNAAEPDVPVGKVEKAPGPTGYRVGDVFSQKKALAGKTVQVRGVVVKATNGVMGKNFIHLRDGSGDAKAATNDLTVTLDRAGNPGETVLVEGTVILDRDIGAGYRYDVLLENARVR